MKRIALSQGLYAMVDDEDFEVLNQWKWYAHKAGGLCYARRNMPADKTGKRGHVKMHRFILGLTDAAIHCDHIDGNGLNNQRENLRKATNALNVINRGSFKNSVSKYKGVDYCKARKKWRAQIQYQGKGQHIGLFNTEIEAAIAYNKSASIHHGQFARLNIIDQNTHQLTH